MSPPRKPVVSRSHVTSGWVTALGVIAIHPYLAEFPPLEGAALEWLALDIRQHGLHVPLVRDLDGVLLDGRARLEACRRVGVPPLFTTWGGDPVAYIAGVNLERRSLTQDQLEVFRLLKAATNPAFPAPAFLAQPDLLELVKQGVRSVEWATRLGESRRAS